MIDPFAIWDRACHDATKLPEGWRGNLFTAVGDPPNRQGVMIKGAVSPVRTRGPRKGEPNWPKRDRSTERQVFVSNEAYERAKQALTTGAAR
jgi:hypothetical protein